MGMFVWRHVKMELLEQSWLWRQQAPPPPCRYIYSPRPELVRQSQNCLEQSHHHEVYGKELLRKTIFSNLHFSSVSGSYWVTPCLRIVGPLRCRIWSTRCTSYCFFSSSHSFPTLLPQYPRPRSSPSPAVVTLSPSLTAGPIPCPSCSPSSSFSPPSCISFSPWPSTSGWCSIWIWSCFCTCTFSFGCSSCPSTFRCSSRTSAICPCTSSNPCNPFQPVPCSGWIWSV